MLEKYEKVSLKCVTGYNTPMIGAIFSTLIYNPLYNGLVFLIGIIPTHDAGIAVILLTIVVRIIIYPLSRRAVQSQFEMKKIAPEIEELKKKYKKNSPEQSQAIMALYKERGVHPFSSFLLVLIQFPILIGLYWVFSRGGLPMVNAAVLYPFVHVPQTVNMIFVGLVDISAKHNIILAALTALTQFAYTRLSMGPRGVQSATEATLSSDMAKSFDVQARYVFPLLIGVIAYVVPAAAPLYFTTSNLFMIAQEYVAGRRFTSNA